MCSAAAGVVCMVESGVEMAIFLVWSGRGDLFDTILERGDSLLSKKISARLWEGFGVKQGCQRRKHVKERRTSRKEGCQGRKDIKEGRTSRKEGHQRRKGVKEGCQ